MFSSVTAIFVVAFLLTGTTRAASPRPVKADPYHDYLITTEHIALPSAAPVNAIVRDDRGFLWFGTTRGLCKYDGYEVRVFKHGSDADRNQRFITGMTKTADGSLLLASWNGLWLFDLRTERFTPFPDDVRFADGIIDAIAGDPRGTLWIGMRRAGLFSYSHTTQTVRHYTTKDGLSANGISSLLLDGSGMLWIGTYNGGLNVLDPTTSRFVHYRRKPSDRGTLSSDHVAAIHENDNQELWIVTAEGLDILDRLTGRVRRLHFPSSGQISVGAIGRDFSGVMWVGVQGRGMMSYFNETWKQVAPSPDRAITLSDVFITKIYPDAVSSSHGRQVLWIGTRAGGVNKMQMVKNPFTNSIRDEDSLLLGRGAVLSVCEDRKGIVWVGLWGGGLDALVRTGGGYKRIAHYQPDPHNPFSLPNDNVGSLLEDREGVLWIGTSDGLATFDTARKRFTTYRHDKSDSTSLTANNINGVYEDHLGRVWIWTESGLSLVVRGKRNPNGSIDPRGRGHFKNYLHSPQDAHAPRGNAVTDVIEDRSGNLWASMKGGGLNKLDDEGRFIRFLHPHDTSGRMENFVHSMYEDGDGLLWLQTGAGLVTFDVRSGIFKRYEDEQLNEAQVSGIENDRAGNLWLSTLGGLFKLNPRTHNFLWYGDAQGLPLKVLTSTFFRNSRGKLYVGGLNGFTEFFPDSVFTPTTPPGLYITGFSVFDKAMPATVFVGSEINLEYDQNFFSFSFAALDYTDPMRNRYVYRMVGVDRDWVDAGLRNYASYTNLDPGAYVFQVKGRNSDGVWSEAETSVNVTISPPYWGTWWFRIFAAGILAGILYAIYRYRLMKLIEMERLRLRIAHDLHDDVGSNLSAIAMASRSVQRSARLPDSAKRRLAEIYETAVLTQEGMRDLVWFIKPDNDTLDDLFVRMKETAASLLEDIDVDFQLPQTGEALKVTVDFKRNLFLAFKEILTNIAKHASASRVEIHIGIRDGLIEMIIRDNGRGFNGKMNHQGTGLQSIQRRAQSISGSCEITTRPGHGTTVTFTGRM